jgi:hypothetical protein
MAADGSFAVDFEEFARLSRYTAFLYFKTMSDALAKDTQRYQAECIKLKSKQSDENPLTPEEYAELGFWHRGHARAFLIFVEGLLYVMRQLISHAEERGEIRLSLGEGYLIRETDYLIQGDKIQERPRFSRLTDSFRLTFRLFPQVLALRSQLTTLMTDWSSSSD